MPSDTQGGCLTSCAESLELVWLVHRARENSTTKIPYNNLPELIAFAIYIPRGGGAAAAFRCCQIAPFPRNILLNLTTNVIFLRKFPAFSTVLPLLGVVLLPLRWLGFLAWWNLCGLRRREPGMGHVLKFNLSVSLLCKCICCKVTSSPHVEPTIFPEASATPLP